VDVGAGVGRGGRVAGGTVVAGGATVVAGGEGASVEGGGGVPGDGVESGLFVGCGVGAGFVVGCGVGAGLVVGCGVGAGLVVSCGVGAGLVVGCGVGAGFVDGAGVSVGAGFVEAAGVSVGAGFVDGVSWAKTAVESSRRTAGEMGGKGKEGSVDGSTNSVSALSPPPLSSPLSIKTRARTRTRGGGGARAAPNTANRRPAVGCGRRARGRARSGGPSDRPAAPWSVSPMEAVRIVGAKWQGGASGAKEKDRPRKSEKKNARSANSLLAKKRCPGRTPRHPPASTHAAPTTRRARKRRSPLSWGLRKTHAPFYAGPAAPRPGGGEAG